MATGLSRAVGLALLLACRSLRHHRVVGMATVLGVAIGMSVVCAILIVDNNTRAIAPQQAETTGSTLRQAGEAGSDVSIVPMRAVRSPYGPRINHISFDRKGQKTRSESRLVPTQKGGAANSTTGNEDYAAMRLAVRLASLLSFLVGAVIVFYTMRFSVAVRAREFCLLLCLGQSRAGVSLSLVAEALILGLIGTGLGLGLAVPVGQALLALGISTTGQMPVGTALIPWGELSAMAGISIVIALMGVAGPVREIYRMDIAQILQPRFLSGDNAIGTPGAGSFAWLLPPAIAAAYVLVRPFLISWLSVVHFFLFEAAFVTLLAAATLWWATPLLKWGIRFFETVLKPVLPLETLLTGKRMRLGSRQITFAVTGIVLVFGMLTALHDITRSLKDEIAGWASAAMVPYMFYERTSRPFDAAGFAHKLEAHGLVFVRMSEKLGGALPMRLVHSDDVNRHREQAGRPLLLPGTVIASKTLAARYDLEAGDTLILSGDGGEKHRFEIIEIADDLGFYAEDGRYVDIKSYLVFSEGNALFADNLESTLGQYGTARFADGALPLWRPLSHDALYPYYLRTHFGLLRGYHQSVEIDRDFRIFDFILAMTVLLAALGVANTLLIQVHGRGREFSVLRTIGMDRWQITKMLLAEGLIIGFVGALLAAVAGNALGAISVSFLDHFTLFDYRFRLSLSDTLLFSALCIATCSAAALYPAFVAARTSSAESLHYE
jgi:putative ABC transport system permease protein